MDEASIPMLREDVVDRIFARLQLAYAAAWLRMWDGLDIDAVKVDWRRRLAWVTSSKQVAYALDNLPPAWPPTAMQFSDLCKAAPRFDEAVLELPAPYQADPARVQAIRDRLAGRLVARNPIAWRQDMVRKMHSGEAMGIYQREAARALERSNALRIPVPDLFSQQQVGAE